ncbi:MAG: DUF4831 family protein [Paludibacteraceae bacterium]|nr:DUF4831 family protein [Paludibacteraceae bacterium]
MKRSILTWMMLAMAVGFVSAQALTTTDAALVYYMPKTILAFDVKYTETTRMQGPFYQYAERYLGTKDIVMADEKVYELKDVDINTKTVADKDRAYKFTPSGNQKANIRLDSKGLLEAYNQEQPAEKKTDVYDSRESRDEKPFAGKKALKKENIAPLSEEALFASSKAKMAEAAAKQIYRIREARTNLISGDVEHMPTDSKMLDRMLDELDEQEAELVELFVGTTKVKRLHKTVYLTPEQDEQGKVLLRFSKFAGPVAADDMSGEPVVLNMTVSKQELQQADEKAKAPAVSEIYYNLPGEATVKVVDSKGKLLSTRTLPIAQFGVSVALPMDLIRRKPHIIFNTRTGAIKSITE